jgi:hypothetical protein
MHQTLITVITYSNMYTVANGKSKECEHTGLNFVTISDRSRL